MAQSGSRGRIRGTEKSPSAYRTISEVSEELDVPQHVLRFWETKFSQVRPLKRGGGRRYYRPEDLRLLQTIRQLLYEEGYTIKGVQKLLREGRATLRARQEAAEALAPVPGAQQAAGQPVEAGPEADEMEGADEEEMAGRADLLAGVDPRITAPQLSPATRNALNDVLRELKALRELLRRDRR